MKLLSLPSFLARGLLRLTLAALALPALATDTPTLDKHEQAFVAKAPADDLMRTPWARSPCPHRERHG